MTDHGSSVAGVASFIAQLASQPNELGKKDIAALCKIKVIRRVPPNFGGSRRHKVKISKLGNRTWLVGLYYEEERDRPAEQKLIEQITKSLAKELKASAEVFSYIRWGKGTRFARGCREGDSLIQVLRASKQSTRPYVVFKQTPVLRKQRMKKGVIFYIQESKGRNATLTWGRFQRLLKRVGYKRRLGRNVVRAIKSELADVIQQNWNSAAK